MAREQIVVASEERGRFDAVLARCDGDVRDADPLVGAFGRRYYPAVFGAGLADRSFAVLTPEAAALVVECDVLDGTLGRFGNPLRLLAAGDGADRNSLVRCALDHLRSVAAASGAERVLVADPATGATASGVGAACLAVGGRLVPRVHAVADLSVPEDQLVRDVRGSYRSLINWGRRSLELDHCDASNADRSVFDEYRDLHAAVAGRVTRANDSWDAMFATIAEGSGELVVSRLDGEAVGGTLVVDGTTTSAYASGAYRRDLDLPLGHWPLLAAIERARERRRHWFDLGEVSSVQNVTDKERSIAFFKRGFTSRLEVRVVWELPVG